jgi:hypothetical protein
MPIDLTCPCGKRFRVADMYAGQRGQCPTCGLLLDIGRHDHAAPAGTVPLRLEVLPPTISLEPTRFEVSPPSVDEKVPRPPLVVSPAAAAPRPARPAFWLFSPGAIFLAALCGSFLGGMLLLAYNYRSLRRQRAAAVALLCGVLGTALGVVGVLAYPAGQGTMLVLHLLAALTMYPVAQWLLGLDYDAHLNHRGEQAPAWAALLAGLACGVAVLLGGLTLSAFVFTGGPGTVVFGTDETIVYGKGTTRDQARRLGHLLQRESIFNGLGPKRVELSRKDNTYVVAFPIQDKLRNDLELLSLFRALHSKLEREVFPEQGVEIHLCDSSGVARVIRQSLGRRIAFGDKEEVYYGPGVSEDLARQLDRFLRDKKRYFDGEGIKTVRLSREEDGYRLAFILEQGWNDPQVQANFRELGRLISAQVLDRQPVAIQLWDPDLVPRCTLPGE